MKLVLAAIAIFFGVIVLTMCVVCPIDALSCSSRWKDSGMRSRYGIFSDCQIEVAPGRWIPAAKYFYKKEIP